jgi:hypothetical protein
MNKEEISKMTKEEQIRQLEWSDPYEFSYWYAYYLLDYINQLETNRDEAIEYIKSHTSGVITDEDIVYVTPSGNILEILERGKENEH